MPNRNLHQFTDEGGKTKPLSTQVGLNTESTTQTYQIDLLDTPADETLLEYFDVNQLLALEIIPWRKFGERLVYATGSVTIEKAPPAPKGVSHTNFVTAEPERIRNSLERHLAQKMLVSARNL